MAGFAPTAAAAADGAILYTTPQEVAAGATLRVLLAPDDCASLSVEALDAESSEPLVSIGVGTCIPGSSIGSASMVMWHDVSWNSGGLILTLTSMRATLRFRLGGRGAIFAFGYHHGSAKVT